jgi:hypothetical protein
VIYVNMPSTSAFCLLLLLNGMSDLGHSLSQRQRGREWHLLKHKFEF